VEDGLGRGFWTAKGVRQECSASPVLFNIVMANLEEKMNKIKWREIRLGEKRILVAVRR